MIRSLLRAAVLGLIGVSVAGMVGALVVKRRVVPHDDPDADEVTLVAAFSPLLFRSRASAFTGGRLECWYGGGVVDLRSATLAPGGAHLAVRMVFGGGQIVVPDSWRVTVHVLGLGGASDTRPPMSLPDDAPELFIDGTTMFGGFQVTSVVAPEMERQLDETVSA